MPAQAQRYADSVLGGSARGGATGTVAFPALALRRHAAVTVTVTGGSATLTLHGGCVPDGIVGQIASSGALATSWSYVTEAPWGALELRWASNGGTVAVDVMTWD